MIGAIAAKELRLLFASLLAWVILAFVQVILALVFLFRLNEFLVAQPQIALNPAAPGVTEVVAPAVFGTACIVLLMVAPLLSMRLIAEERRNQTLPFLMSAPVSVLQIVLGKFLAMVAFFGLTVALMVLMCLSLYLGGRIDFGLLAANAVGLLLLCGAFAAVGLYLSSLTTQPLVAAVGTYLVLLTLWLINAGSDDPDSVLHLISIIRHFDPFARGILALKDAAYYVALMALFLLLSIRRLDADRLRA